MNFFNPKNRRVISGIIIGILILSMVLSVVLGALSAPRREEECL